MDEAIEGFKLKPFIEKSAQSSMEEWVGVVTRRGLELGEGRVGEWSGSVVGVRGLPG
jgi:hypothetical protein